MKIILSKCLFLWLSVSLLNINHIISNDHVWIELNESQESQSLLKENEFDEQVDYNFDKSVLLFSLQNFSSKTHFPKIKFNHTYTIKVYDTDDIRAPPYSIY